MSFTAVVCAVAASAGLRDVALADVGRVRVYAPVSRVDGHVFEAHAKRRVIHSVLDHFALSLAIVVRALWTLAVFGACGAEIFGDGVFEGGRAQAAARDAVLGLPLGLLAGFTGRTHERFAGLAGAGSIVDSGESMYALARVGLVAKDLVLRAGLAVSSTFV